LHNYGKQLNYFTTSSKEDAELITRMTDLDRLCELLTADEYCAFFSLITALVEEAINFS